MSTDKDFWSRRRAAVAAEEQARKQAEAREAELAEVEAARAELEDLPEAELLEKLDLPDPDTLKPGDDFTAFLRDVVPEHLRRRALRRLWRSNPVLANLDGLNDYDGDFTNAATDAPGVKTAYRVGKGLLKHVEALAAEATAKAEAEAAPAIAQAAPDASVMPDPVPDPVPGNASGPVPDPVPDLIPEQAGDRPSHLGQDAGRVPEDSPANAGEPAATGPSGEDGSPGPSRRRITFSFNV